MQVDSVVMAFKLKSYFPSFILLLELLATRLMSSIQELRSLRMKRHCPCNFIRGQKDLGSQKCYVNTRKV